jgi:MYXO-CTERM domain-containing protein
MRYARRTDMFTSNRLIVGAMLSGLAAFMLLGMRSEAQACGGLFCGAPPVNPLTPLPVAQNGENIVFSITKDPAGGAPTLQAHIQILYTGDAAKFSWVVPVDAMPTLSTGSDRLFTALANVTQPRFVATNQTSGTCISQGFGGASGAAGGFGTGAAGTTGAGGGGGGGGVMVSFQGAVGPFDAAVIKSDDSLALRTWLTDNGYVVSDQAVGLIDAYVLENKYFVALKLLNGVGVRSIQPIVLTFKGVEACVPLRLTAIAANPNMPVLVWVLGQERVAPRGFYEIKIDEMRINWMSGGSNYFGASGLVSLAANEAGGKAFVTEYAGPSTVARAQVYTNGQFNVATLRAAMTPPAYLSALTSMSGLANDTLMLPLLAQYIPMPDAVKAMGVTEAMFYGNIGFYWTNFAFPPFDLAGLTTAIETSIIKPRVDAQMMIDAHPYLTRLNTFISPDEMDKDPFFFEARDLADVSNVHTAVLRTMCGNAEYMACNAPQRLELPDGRTAWVRAGSKATVCGGTSVDVVGLQSLPATEVAWEREDIGQGVRVIDNTAMIAAGIATHNAKFVAEQMRFPISGSGGSGGSGGGAAGGRGGAGGSGLSGGSGGGGVVAGVAGMGGSSATGVGGEAGGAGMGGSGPLGTGGTVVTGTGGTMGPGAADGGGCGCHVGGDDAGGIGLATLLGAFVLRVVRRRRRR